MPDQNRPTCPITGRPLPDGHTIHPSLAAEVHDQANRIAAIIPETMKHTPPTHTSGARTQPTFKPSKPSPNSYTKTRANNSTKPHTARPPQPGTKSRAPYTKTPAASRKPQTPPPPTPKPRAY